eukprot:COSAG01_NODE_991_length_12286_cov_4.629605_15_plen_70_part_00
MMSCGAGAVPLLRQVMGGSPGFMCPAVLGGRAPLSTASDIYSFGVVILNTMCPPEVRPNGCWLGRRARS